MYANDPVAFENAFRSFESCIEALEKGGYPCYTTPEYIITTDDPVNLHNRDYSKVKIVEDSEGLLARFTLQA